MRKLLIFIFVLFFILILFYQRNYLNDLKNEALQVSERSTNINKIVVGKGENFKTLFYDKKGHLNAQMTGNTITYFNDATFEAEGNLIYQTFDENEKLANTIKTESALGVFRKNDEALFLLSGSNQLESLKLPGYVTFDLNGNQGRTKKVFIDAINRTISSNEFIESSGPDGQFSANGFFYDVDKKNFKFDSKVRGIYKKNNREEKKK